MSVRVIIVGAGGHAHVIADALLTAGVEVSGFTDSDASLHGGAWHGLRVLGGDEVLLHPAKSIVLANGIGSVKNTTLRRQVFERLVAAGHRFRTVLHPSATVSPRCTIGEGAQVMAGAVIQADARLGINALVNTGVLVDHDCDIGAHVHLAPGTTLSGNVRVGEGTHVGTGASVIQGVQIGAHCFIAAGAVVISDVPDKSKVAGVPAKRLPR